MKLSTIALLCLLFVSCDNTSEKQASSKTAINKQVTLNPTSNKFLEHLNLEMELVIKERDALRNVASSLRRGVIQGATEYMKLAGIYADSVTASIDIRISLIENEKQEFSLLFLERSLSMNEEITNHLVLKRELVIKFSHLVDMGLLDNAADVMDDAAEEHNKIYQLYINIIECLNTC